MIPSKLKEKGSCQLLNVRLRDDFDAAHLEGAAHNSVFDVENFPEALLEIREALTNS